MSDARQTVQAARAIDHDIISQSKLLTAEALLQRAEVALAEGDFSVAKINAVQARAFAMRAQQVVRDDR